MSDNNQSTCKVFARLLSQNVNLRDVSNRSVGMRANFIKMMEAKGKIKDGVRVVPTRKSETSKDLSNIQDPSESAEEVSNKSQVKFKEGANVFAHLHYLEGKGPNLLEDLPKDKNYDFPNFEETAKFKNAHDSPDFKEKQNDNFVDSGDVWDQIRASEVKSSAENCNIIPAGADLGSYMRAYVNKNKKSRK